MAGPLPKMIVITMKRKKASHQSSDQRTCDTGEPTKGSQTWKEPLSQDTEKVIFCDIRKTPRIIEYLFQVSLENSKSSGFKLCI